MFDRIGGVTWDGHASHAFHVYVSNKLAYHLLSFTSYDGFIDFFRIDRHKYSIQDY